MVISCYIVEVSDSNKKWYSQPKYRVIELGGETSGRVDACDLQSRRTAGIVLDNLHTE